MFYTEVGGLQVGQEFIPYQLFVGTFVPMGLASNSKIGWTAKGVYGQLAFHAGTRGVCWPSIDTLAKECGVSRRTCQNALKELLDNDFIMIVGTRNRRTMWAFVWHECLESSVKSCSRQELHTSTRESRQDLPTTPIRPIPGPDDEAKCADIAHDSRQDLPMIVGNNCLLPINNVIRQTEEVNGIGKSSSSTFVEDSTADASANARAPDDDLKIFVRQQLRGIRLDTVMDQEIAELSRNDDRQLVKDCIALADRLTSYKAKVLSRAGYLADLAKDFGYDVVRKEISKAEADGKEHKGIIEYVGAILRNPLGKGVKTTNESAKRVSQFGK